MTGRYHCDGCGWDGETPTLADDPLGGLIFVLKVCPECATEVYETVILDEPDAPPATS